MEENILLDIIKPLIIKSDFNKVIKTPDLINLESNYKKDLGFDSLDMCELQMYCESKFNIKLDYELWVEDMSVEKSLFLIKNKIENE